MSDGGEVTCRQQSGRDGAGRFARGNPGGPGRPKGSIDLIALARRRSKSEGYDLRQALWEALRAMIEAARKGDSNAARIVFERLCTPVDRGAAVEVNVATHFGPPVPAGADLLNYTRTLGKLAEELFAEPAPNEAPAAAPALPEARPQLAPLLDAIPPTDPPRAALPEVEIGAPPWRNPVPRREYWNP